jgi:hypothetical protein
VSAVHADEARRLLLEHADRTREGPLEDPADLAAVVGVERIAVAGGSDDPGAIRAAVEARGGHDPALDEVVAEALAQVAVGLERRASGEAADAGVVNADAGRHEIVTDAAALRAGVRASQRSYDATPYYRLRYGGRGARFASTDTAWLISLADQGEDHAVQNVRWLGRVLANRGMPTWLLETHLHALAAELSASLSDDAAGALPAAADALAATRRRHVDDDLLARADAWAERALGEGLPFEGAGRLTAAACADDLAGVTRDDGAFFGWLVYPERVHPDEADALREVRARIRAAAR